MSRIFTSAEQLIGGTPLLELTHIEAREGLQARILAKLEYLNPAGSVFESRRLGQGPGSQGHAGRRGGQRQAEARFGHY